MVAIFTVVVAIHQPSYANIAPSESQQSSSADDLFHYLL